ncbi:hypothetical protein [uncultured Limimaricola sp.]|uniref:hypothetical protein n=1 Tax=uncultured Limimaricola sp. TaxID=2211667 RepID=UPI0030F9FF9B
MKTLTITSRDPQLTSTEIRAALKRHLHEVNGRARVHTLDADDILALAKRVERTLVTAGVTQRHRAGTRVSFLPGGPGSAYAQKGYYVVTTVVTLRRTRDGWRLASAEKAEIPAARVERLDIEITERAEADILRRSFDGLSVRRAA